ncbi:putative epoxide hydrolase [Pestalotiopsis sp. NC0098]|nr:putative epoxide hydrolase [Pestalotiopsis sp. NC0098]
MAAITEHDVAYSRDRKIHYLAAGPLSGPLIIFVHGWPASAITWKPQMEAFAALGFRAVAPDTPGYGLSTARKDAADYTQEAIVEGMMALLADTGRDAAVWVGHDWGAGVTSSVAQQHPEAVTALANLCVPYGTIELGWDGFLPLVNRELYPKDQYEYGQWDYMKNYEESFESTVDWFERDIAGMCKAVMQPSKPPTTRLNPFASIRKTGWFGGLPAPPPVDKLGPPIVASDVFERYTQDMQRTGYWGGTNYYMHHATNAKYHAAAPNGGKLKQPVLFIHATWDTVCDTKTSRLAEHMRKLCSNLTEVTVEAGHWVQFEKPAEVNAALARFIVESVPSEWPGFWDSGFVKRESNL